MSLERVIKALIGLGLSRVDAEFYVYLAKKGPQTGLDLARALDFSRKKTYASLRNLQTKGLVTKVHTIFSALPFEEALDLLIKMEKEQTQVIHECKKELLTTWETKE